MCLCADHPVCLQEGPPPPITTNVKQLPSKYYFFLKYSTFCLLTYQSTEIFMSSFSTGSYSNGTYDIFTVNKSADYFIYGWLRFSDVPGNDVTLYQTFGGQQRTLSTQKANKMEISFFHKIKLAKGVKICIKVQLPYTDSLFHMHEL